MLLVLLVNKSIRCQFENLFLPTGAPQKIVEQSLGGFLMKNLFYLLAAWPILAMSGVGSTGGGHAVVCKGSSSQVKSVELLDIFEARNERKLNIKTALGSEELEYLRFVKDRDNALGVRGQYDTESLLAHFRRTVKNVMSLTDKQLPLIDDHGSTSNLPSGCEIEQLAVFYDDKNQYEVNQFLWNRLDSLNRLALFVHELQWRKHRLDTREKTSIFVRNYVGGLFSKESVITTKFEYPSGALVCHAGINVLENHDGTISIDWNYRNQSTMVIFPDSQVAGKLRVHMTKMFGRNLPSIVQFQIPSLNIEMQSLVHEVGKRYSELRVVDVDANFSEVLDPISVVPVLYKLRVNYIYGGVFSLDLVDSNGSIIESNPVSYCIETK